MDFRLSDEQQAVRNLARQVFTDKATVERIKEVERSQTRLDDTLWASLANAGLVGLVVPETYGGAGLTIVEAALLLIEQGRRVAPVSLWTTIISALAIADHGSPEQQVKLLPGVADGSVRLSALLSEPGEDDPYRTSIRATSTPDGWLLNGAKPGVFGVVGATMLLVPARLPDSSVAVFMVSPNAVGLTLQHFEATNRQLATALTFESVGVTALDRLGHGPSVVRFLVHHALVALAALQVGIVQEATRIAAEYTSNRRQFGKPLSVFQGVSHKAADGYIAAQAMEVTMLSAAWRLATGLDATAEVMVAKWWAAEGGHDTIHKTQHIHGGMGADIDYPSHRYFLWGKTIENTLGGASAWAARLGAHLVTRPLT
jgi:3-oxocholest-4-en-26-oyl-CoA dehydrogenase beta subunit